MIRATLYIVRCTMRNRLRARVRRLRQPRYLVGAIVGAAYVYLTIFARRRQPRPGRSEAAATLSVIVAGAPPVVGTGILGIAALAWLVPVDTGLVTFSDAEVDFLFTAPVTRRQLLLHRLIRGQIALLFGAVIAGLVYPGISPATRLRTSLALWLVLITIRVYATGVMQARRGFSAAAARLRQAAWAPAVVVAAATVVVGMALARAFAAEPAANLPDAMRVVHRVATSGLPARILAPCVALVRPFFAADWRAYLAALGPAMLVLAAVTVWLIRTDEAFYERNGTTTADPAARSRPMPAAARHVPWKLAPLGRPEVAMAWRAAVEMVRGAGNAASMRPVIAIVAIAFGVVMGSRQRGLAQVAAVFATAGAGGAIVLGPQILRIDLRQDLRNIDLLKTWPVRPADLIRGEILWPGAVLTAIGWVTIALALLVSGGAFARYPLALRASVAASIALVAPAMIAAQLTIQNAAALAFPAWIATGSQRPRGLDALGQRLILMGATMLLLVMMLLPGAVGGAAIWFALRHVAGVAVLVPAAIVCTAIVMLEVLVATEAMAPLYEKLDLSEIERSET